MIIPRAFYDSISRIQHLISAYSLYLLYTSCIPLCIPRYTLLVTFPHRLALRRLSIDLQIRNFPNFFHISHVLAQSSSPAVFKMVAAPAGHDSGQYSPGYATSSVARSLSPQQQQQQEQQEQRYHRRGYQACDPCRKRKVKCDLGSTFNPILGNQGEEKRKRESLTSGVRWLNRRR